MKGLVVSRSALPITLSIGLTFAVPRETAISMLARADMALYNAKRAGRNCTRVLLAPVDTDSLGNADTFDDNTVMSYLPAAACSAPTGGLNSCVGGDGG